MAMTSIRGGIEIFKKGSLTGPQYLEGVAGKEGVTFLGGCSFNIKIFNDKKIINKKVFLCHN